MNSRISNIPHFYSLVFPFSAFPGTVIKPNLFILSGRKKKKTGKLDTAVILTSERRKPRVREVKGLGPDGTAGRW